MWIIMQLFKKVEHPKDQQYKLMKYYKSTHLTSIKWLESRVLTYKSVQD